MAARDRQSDLNDASKERYDESAKSLSPLSIGATVQVQNPKTKSWDGIGVIVGIGRYRSYRIKSPSGSVMWRNRRFLRRRLIVPSAIQPNPPPMDQVEKESGNSEHASLVNTPSAAQETPEVVEADGASAPQATTPPAGASGSAVHVPSSMFNIYFLLLKIVCILLVKLFYVNSLGEGCCVCMYVYPEEASVRVCSIQKRLRPRPMFP